MPILSNHELLSAAHRLGAVTEGEKTEAEPPEQPQLPFVKARLEKQKLRCRAFEPILIILRLLFGYV